MDFMTIAGFIVGLVAILGGLVLEGGHVGSIIQITAFIIVGGGTLGAVLVNFPLSVILDALKAIKDVFFDHPQNPHKLVDDFVDYARRARADGILALEADAEATSDPFLKRAISLAVDGTAPAVVRATLESQVDADGKRAHRAASVFEAGGAFAPTIGVLGAVLGLIHVMENLSNPEMLGPGIAVAFVATVYGVAAANMLLLPMAGKLKIKHEIHDGISNIIVEGIAAIQAGLPPSLVEEKLRGLAGPGGGAKAEESKE
jgi:chemotaxis protein MotA